MGDVVDRLMQAIMTPSESVQRSASTAMAPLMPMLDDPERVKQMVRTHSVCLCVCVCVYVCGCGCGCVSVCVLCIS